MSSVEQPPHPDVDLAETYAELYGLLLGDPDAHRFLADIAAVAARGVAPPSSVGVTFQRGGVAATVGASDSIAARADEAQYAAGEGPCLQALRDGCAVEVPDVEAESRWPFFREEAAALGVRSSLSMPLVIDSTTVGALNIYATRPRAFEGHGERGRRFAEQASGALTVVVRQDDQVRLNHQLRQALQSRTVIAQAVGIVMREQGCSAEVALDRLRRRSQDRNVKLHDVAAELVETVGGGPSEPTPFRTGVQPGA